MRECERGECGGDEGFSIGEVDEESMVCGGCRVSEGALRDAEGCLV